MGLLGIMISLLLLMYLAYRGVNVIFIAPIMAAIAVFFSGSPLLANYTQVFMVSAGSYIVSFFPLFLLGAVFGQLMGRLGLAETIGILISRWMGPQRAILAVVLSCAILTYGGVSLFVVAFCMFPIAQSLFSAAGISKKLVPGSIALGSFTFTMTALPGTPAIQNAIPMPFFKTTLYAAPGIGILGSSIIFGIGMVWLNYRKRKLGQTLGNASTLKNISLIDGFFAFLPLILVLSLNFYLSHFFFPSHDASYLSQNLYGNVPLSKVQGIWSLIAALVVGIFWLIVYGWKKSDVKEITHEGAMGSLLPIFNTASEVGYGKVIATLPAFAGIKQFILDISFGNPVVSTAVAVNLLAGITGSASGGMSIALEAFGQTYLDMANTQGISPDLLHRIASMSSGGLDTLPHNGAVITLLTICKMSHKDSYVDIFVTSVLVTVTVGFSMIGVATLAGGSF